MLRPKKSVLEDFSETECLDEFVSCRNTASKSKCCYDQYDCLENEVEEIDDYELDDVDFHHCTCGCHSKPRPPKPCPPKPCPPKPCPEPDPEPETPNCAGQVLAMAYVKDQEFKIRSVYSCEKALRQGTLFPELDKPFEGGTCHD